MSVSAVRATTWVGRRRDLVGAMVSHVRDWHGDVVLSSLFFVHESADLHAERLGEEQASGEASMGPGGNSGSQ
jgi:hypothetical protein